MPQSGNPFEIWTYDPASTGAGAGFLHTANGPVGRWVRATMTGAFRDISVEGPLYISDFTAGTVFGTTIRTPFTEVVATDDQVVPWKFVVYGDPAIAADVPALLAADIIPGRSRWALVLTGTYAGSWVFCPTMTDPDNGTTRRRPDEITSDATMGRWVFVHGFSTGGGSGTVTSVGLSLPPIFSVTGSPVTTAGTLSASLANQNANTVWAGPSSGGAAAPSFRALVAADIPPLGSIYQPLDSDLTAIGGLVTTAFGRGLLTEGSASSLRTTAGLVIGTHVQAADAALLALAGGSDFVQFSGPASSTKVFSLPNANAAILTDNAPVTVPQGGSGAASLTGYLRGNGASPFTAVATVPWSDVASKPTTLGGYGITDGITSAAASAAFQPLDSDLTAIGGLATTPFGRGLLDDADPAAGRVSMGLVIGTDVQGYDADLDDLADGSLSGSKVGVGINANNVTQGTLPDARLATVATAVGSFGNGSFIPSITIDAQGRVTGVITNAVSGGGGSTPAITRRYRSGYYYQVNPDPNGDLAFGPTQNMLMLVPFPVGEATTIDRITCGVIGTGNAGSVVRLGFYNDDDGFPGALLFDAGTVDATSSGYKEITVSQSLTANTLYWVAFCWQGGSPGSATVRASGIGSGASWVPHSAASSDPRVCVLAQTGVTGAFPSTLSINSNATQGPAIKVRIQ